jgi:hypothetical protein
VVALRFIGRELSTARRRWGTGSSVIACGLLTAACGSTAKNPRQAGTTPLRHPLPPGFSAPGTNRVPQTPGVLEVHPLTQLRVGDLHRAPQPAGMLRTTSLDLVNQPVPVHVQPLLVSAQVLQPGETVTVAAGRLGTARVHAALFILQGPSYRAERLVQVRYGVAAAAVSLPRAMARGLWALGVEDLSGLHSVSHDQVSGIALLDLGIFSVG